MNQLKMYRVFKMYELIQVKAKKQMERAFRREGPN